MKLFLPLLLAIVSIVSMVCYAEGQPTKVESVSDRFIPSGWMGDIDDIALNVQSTNNPYSGPECIEIIYSAAKSKGAGWAGIYWQYPENNWGHMPGWNDVFTGAKRLTFWARGLNGGETSEFKMGGIAGRYSDSVRPAISTGVITLSKEWRQYSINLNDKDLSHVIGGFCWVTNIIGNPRGCTIYLDDIRYEW
jgi:hypothetical protein